MKKYIILLWASFLSLASFGSTEIDRLEIDNVSMKPGETALVTITRSNTSAAYSFVSFQMDLYLPDGITLNKSGCSLGSSLGNQELVIGRQSDGAYRLTSTSFSLTPVTGNTVDVVNLSITSSETAVTGNASVKNIIFVDGNSKSTELSDKTFQVIIKQKQSTSLAALPEMTYGDDVYSLPAETDQGLSLSWTVANSTVASVSGNVLTIIGAGTTTVTATQAGNDFYEPFTKEYTLTVNKAPLTVTANRYTINQGDPLPTFDATYSGFKNNDDTSVLTTQPTFSCSASSSSNFGTYTITVSGAVADNYNIIYVAGLLTIMGDQTLNMNELPIMTYGDGSYALPSHTNQALFYGSTPSLICNLSWSSNNTYVAEISEEKVYPIEELRTKYYYKRYINVGNAGTAIITATSNGYGCLNSFSKEYILTVKKAPLTVTAQSYTIKQGDPMPTFTANYYGFKKKETASVLTSLPAFSCSATSASAPGTYDIIVSGAEAQNYEMTYVKGTLTITEADPLTITAKSYIIKYGDALPNFEYTTEGVTLVGIPALSCEASSTSPVGTYPIIVTKGSVENYNVTYVAGTLTIEKAPLTITAKDASMVFGGEQPAFEVTYNGFVNGEDASVLTKQPSFNCSATSSSAIGTYDINVSGAEAKNYTIGYVKGTLTIIAKGASNLTIGDIVEQTYTGSAITPAVTVNDGTTALTDGTDYTVTYSDNVNVGTATVTVTGKGNYSGTKMATFAIGKAPLTITAKDATMVFGGELPIFEVTYNGFVNSEDVSVLTKQPTISTEATSTSPSGTYAIIASGAEAQNYAISYVNGTLTIGKRTQSIAMDDNMVMTYGDGTFTLPEETEQGLLIDWSSDNATVAAVVGNTLMVKGAGTATLTAEQEGDNNNQPMTKDITLTVNKAPLTVTAKSYTIEQGQSLPTFAATYEGFVNNQTEKVLTKQPTFSCEAANSDVPGTYAITASGAEAKNYEMSYVAGTLTITRQADVTVKAQSYTIKYGDELPEFEYTTEGAELTGTPLLSCEVTSASSVGTYPITVSKGSVENYNVTYVAGTLTIEKAPLTVKAQDATMTYGEALPSFDASYEGFKNNDDAAVLTTAPTMSTAATPASAVGTYEITANGAEAQNYEMNYVKGTLTISKAALTVTPKNASMTYGDALPTFEVIYEGFKNDDDESVLTTLPSMTTAATPSSTVGTYEIAADGAEAENYVISYGSGTLTVEKAPLTIIAQNYTMKQGDPLPAFNATFEGFKNNETSSVLTKQPKFGCEATSASEPGTYDINVSGAEAQNYEMSYVKGTLTVTQADPVTITAINYTIQYGDELPEFDFTSEGAELTGTPLLSCEATSASPVGTYPITVTKGSVENYNVTYVAGTLTIEKAPLTITAQSYTMVQGEEFPEFEALYDGFKNGETESALKRKPQLATFADEYSGPGEYEIIVSGARSDNYDITYVNGTLTIEANSGIATYIAKIPGSSVVLRSKNGEITVEGLTDGQRVSIHTYGGMLIGTATTVDGKATINTSLTPGSIVIVRVGNKTVKYVVR